MEIVVIPFTPKVTNVNPARAAANELQELIQQGNEKGLEFVSVESIQTVVNTAGCFGITGKSELTAFQLVVFRKKDA